MMTLIGLAITVAYIYSLYSFWRGGETLFWELTTLVTIMLLGHWLEMRSISQASGALKELARLLPRVATRIIDGQTEEVALEELHEGDLLLIRPGAANENKKMEFARRYQGTSPVRYPHPSLKACLRSTYGLVVYEEHILQICEAFAGLPPGRADLEEVGARLHVLVAQLERRLADFGRAGPGRLEEVAEARRARELAVDEADLRGAVRAADDDEVLQRQLRRGAQAAADAGTGEGVGQADDVIGRPSDSPGVLGVQFDHHADHFPGSRPRHPLVVLQIAFSLALLTAAALFIRGANKAASVETGLKPGASFILEVDASLAGYEPVEPACRIYHGGDAANVILCG